MFITNIRHSYAAKTDENGNREMKFMSFSCDVSGRWSLGCICIPLLKVKFSRFIWSANNSSAQISNVVFDVGFQMIWFSFWIKLRNIQFSHWTYWKYGEGDSNPSGICQRIECNSTEKYKQSPRCLEVNSRFHPNAYNEKCKTVFRIVNYYYVSNVKCEWPLPTYIRTNGEK